MRQSTHIVIRTTEGQGFYDLTPSVLSWVRQERFGTGLLTVFCRHTSASLAITENASPAVRADALRFLALLAPEDRSYEHDEEGPDDMPAHLRALLTQTSLSIPVLDGRPALGTWQGIYLIEHRRRSHHREVVLHCIGE